MILFTNGCSWTYGGGLKFFHPTKTINRLESVWPHHLGNLMGADKVINLAAGSGSNQRIVRTTYNWLLEQSLDDLKKTVAVIQFTEPSRYEIHVPGYDKYRADWLKCKVGYMGFESSRNPITDIHREYNDLRMSVYTDLEGIYSVLSCCEALSSLFRRFDVKYYFWKVNFINYKDKIVPEKISNYLDSNFNWFESDSWQYQRISQIDTHPSFEGHKEIAELMFEHMNNPGSRTG